ncbi:MAG: endonuclease, partial [Acidimicrobiales bacterium]
IFFREVQGVWPEIAPFADRRALASAERLGLGTDARSLTRLVDDDTLPRLVAALVRVDRKGAAAEVRAAARAA